MPADYIPGADAAFATWQYQFATYLNANLAALGLAPATGAHGRRASERCAEN